MTSPTPDQNQPHPIALLGGDPAQTAALAGSLGALGFQAAACPGLPLSEDLSAVIVDGPEAASLVTAIKAARPFLPVIALAPDCAAADAILIKPIRPQDLAAKLRALILGAGCQLGPWRFFETKRTLLDDRGGTVRLTGKETALLCHLLTTHAPASKEDLLTTVWGYAAKADTHTVETHIHTLRRKLGGDLLVTSGDGYRLVRD